MSQHNKKSDAPTFIALMFILLICFGLMGLTAMVLPQIAGLILVGGGFFFICVFHYLAWGRFMRFQPDEKLSEDQDK